MRTESYSGPSSATLRICRAILSALVLSTCAASAQWKIVTPPPTTADLRGIDNVGSGVVWASGTEGTVLRTEDAGYLWQRCTVPPGAEHLDFRGIQAFDANTAIVMSSGKGPLSRLYKTTDGCQTWKLLFTNPDPEGCLDGIVETGPTQSMLIGDPVGARLSIWTTNDGGSNWTRDNSARLAALPGEVVFAASNSSLIRVDDNLRVLFGTGGGRETRIFISAPARISMIASRVRELRFGDYKAYRVPLRSGSPTSGVFSIGSETFGSEPVLGSAHFVAVGGDYSLPNGARGTAAFSHDNGESWHRPQTPPHGYRSAVAFDDFTATWITVGPNGTDISTDDGRNWRPLRPDPKLGDEPDADQHWNALSLPYVVGPHGRIGILRPSALSPTAAGKP